jgi:hypothetical protein
MGVAVVDRKADGLRYEVMALIDCMENSKAVEAVSENTKKNFFDIAGRFADVASLRASRDMEAVEAVAEAVGSRSAQSDDESVRVVVIEIEASRPGTDSIVVRYQRAFGYNTRLLP